MLENYDLAPRAKRWIRIGIATLIILVAGLIYRGLFLTFVDTNELGYKYDSVTGEITLLEESGYYHVIPFVTTVHTIDLRPVQVCINANSRVLNCKLVRFNPKGPDHFVFQCHHRLEILIAV